MIDTNINPKDIVFALDIGTRSVIGTVGIVRDKKYYVIDEAYLEHEERAMVDGQIHDISLVAKTVNKIKYVLEERLNIKLSNVSIAAAGRFLKTIVSKAELNLDSDREIDKDLVRSLELTGVKKAEEEINKETNGKLYCVGYSVINYYLNGYIISNLISHKGDNIAADVIATFLPRSVVDSIYSVMDKVGLRVVSMTLEPIAAIEAAIPQNLRLLNLALVDIGAGTSDIAISKEDTISAYGMVSIAGDEVTETIAQNCLVDFNTAENIKRQCGSKDIIKYIDILGLENEISSEEIKNITKPLVAKIAQEIGEKIIELNGGKSPSAVFLVGGGAHTCGIKEAIADKLNIPLQRIAIKGRESITNCVCKNNDLGSLGVTVLGIALISIKKLGHDFIDVLLNGNIISLFNSHKHTVMDVMLQAGINAKMLIGRNGKNIKFTVNGIKRVAFGTLASNAQITVDGKLESIDTEIKEGEDIKIAFAKDGKDPCARIMDYIQKLYSISFYINDIIHSVEPVGIINGKRVSIEEEIKDGDNVQIINAETLGDFVKYFEENVGEYKYYLNGKELEENYHIKEGDRIYKIKNSQIAEENAIDENLAIHNDSEKEIVAEKDELSSDDENKIEVMINEEKVQLTGKDKYVFVDIFNYIDMDLTRIHGNLVLKLNGENASHNSLLKSGDKIEARWEN